MKRISVGGNYLAPASGRAIREMMRIDADAVATERRVAAEQQTVQNSPKARERPKVVVRIHAPHIQDFLASRKKKVEPSF